MKRQESGYCPYRVTKETVQFGNRLQVPEDQIPETGVCPMTESGTGPCQYPEYPESCPQLRNQDLCDFSWAKQD